MNKENKNNTDNFISGLLTGILIIFFGLMINITFNNLEKFEKISGIKILMNIEDIQKNNIKINLNEKKSIEEEKRSLKKKVSRYAVRNNMKTSIWDIPYRVL